MVDGTAAPVADAPAADEPSILDGAKPASDKPADGTAAKPDAGKPADATGKPAADGTKPESDKPAPDAAKPAGAPEKYETFKVPEGVTLNAPLLDKFGALAKEDGLSQVQAQRYVDLQTTAIKEAQDVQAKDFATMQKEWADTTRKELGAHADKELAFAATARDKFLTEGARTILNDSGLSNHPEIIKSLISIGKAISEDGFVPGGPATDKAGKSQAEILYPDQGKK